MIAKPVGQAGEWITSGSTGELDLHDFCPLRSRRAADKYAISPGAMRLQQCAHRQGFGVAGEELNSARQADRARNAGIPSAQTRLRVSAVMILSMESFRRSRRRTCAALRHWPAGCALAG